MSESLNDNSKRASFPQGVLRDYISCVEKIMGQDTAGLAAYLHVSARTVRDWKRQKYSIGVNQLAKLRSLSDLAFPDNILLKPRYWHVRNAGARGGASQYEKNGSVGGDPKLRQKRWRAWWVSTGQFKDMAILERQRIAIPDHSPALAELVGILLGDGGISKYQIAITLHRSDDKEYISFVQKLCAELFKIEPSIVERPKMNVTNIVISRANMVDYFTDMGLVIGNKVHQQVQVPSWILANNEYSTSCVRGLIDTDGSFYIDKHVKNSVLYMNAALNFTNRSKPLLSFVKGELEKIGLHPTQRTPYAVFLRRDSDIKRYFNEIGSSNPKHLKKYQKYVILREQGGVPKRSQWHRLEIGWSP